MDWILTLVAAAAFFGLLGTASQLDAAWAKSIGAKPGDKLQIRGPRALFWGLKQAGWLLLKTIPGTGQPKVEHREYGGLVLRFVAVLLTAISIGAQQLPKLYT